MITKKRNRLCAERVENLIVVKENKKILDEFKRNNSNKVKINVDNNEHKDAFKRVVIVAVEVPNPDNSPPPMMAVFDDDGCNEEEELCEDSSNDDFDVVIHHCCHSS